MYGSYIISTNIYIYSYVRAQLIGINITCIIYVHLNVCTRYDIIDEFFTNLNTFICFFFIIFFYATRSTAPIVHVYFIIFIFTLLYSFVNNNNDNGNFKKKIQKPTTSHVHSIIIIIIICLNMNRGNDRYEILYYYYCISKSNNCVSAKRQLSYVLSTFTVVFIYFRLVILSNKSNNVSVLFYYCYFYQVHVSIVFRINSHTIKISKYVGRICLFIRSIIINNFTCISY